jgi:hypothetical protein
VASTWERWVGDPRNAVLFVLAAVVLLGGGRRLLQARRARRAVTQLEREDVTPEEIELASTLGRAGLLELFRLLEEGRSPEVRSAAGHALSVLWARDELIPEEEKALVRRGFEANWIARRRYPRELRIDIPIGVDYGVPFLKEGSRGVAPGNIEWSHRVTGAKRASLEVFSPWSAGPGSTHFSIVPDDFEGNGPHRLVLETKARVTGLTDTWELALPHVPFRFEFDPLLTVDSLLASPDETRAAVFDQAVRLVRASDDDSAPPTILNLNERMAIRNPPSIVVTPPLPCDLAHSLSIEIEGVAGTFAGGELIAAGVASGSRISGPLSFPIGPLAPIPPEAIERPAHRKLRVRLTPDPARGWANPDVRSIWPGTIESAWVEVDVIRR